jgi:hypothetical protein
MSLTLVTEGASREDIAETIRLLNIDCKRLPHIGRKSELLDPKTKYDRAHDCLNDALDILDLTL